ncbi:ribonuclease H-like domain-containing protein [Trametes polyzona]|nr:ribonuclease H-like domain-containing protein [Trametes polyzona]
MSAGSSKTPPSSNWLALHKTLHKSSSHSSRKRRKLEHAPPALAHSSSSPQPSPESQHAFPREHSFDAPTTFNPKEDKKNGESLAHLRSMVVGTVDHPPAHQQPGKYLALDCEMVGVGIDGTESALARVSLVNFHGAVLLDAFVRPRERVVDYRTQFSGIRPSDMVHAKPFEEVQKQVADLLKDRILVGHAVHNDLKALLLSHPRPQTRDTQQLFHKHKLVRGRRPALRNLVQQELGLTIQSGEHSSVTDARATMALFRLHRKQLEKDFRPLALTRTRSRSRSKSPTRAATPTTIPAKRARASSVTSNAHDDAASASEGDEDVDDVSQPQTPRPVQSKTKTKSGKAGENFPGGGRRGVSSGLSTIVKRLGGGKSSSSDAGKRSGGPKAKAQPKSKTKEKWWKDLGGGGGGAKGGMRLKVER